MKTLLEVRGLVAWISRDGFGDGARAGDDAAGSGLTSRRLGALHLAWEARAHSRGEPALLAEVPDLVLGDSADLDSDDFLSNGAGGVPIRYDARTGALRIATSIVGMPPIYVYRGRVTTAIASDIRLLRNIPGVELEFDATGLIELGHVGHPVEHRTLFADLELAPSGSLLTLGGDGKITVEQRWQLPNAEPLDWHGFLEAQIDAFTNATSQTTLSGSLLSLTAGLDTRTVFSVLAAQQRLLPAATMTGRRQSLDARIARRLCTEYGVDHYLVTFDDNFIDNLVSHTESASLLSGGLASLNQAPEVFLYDQLGSAFGARLSGNLGNQVGRGGTEGVSLRGADVGILGPRFKTEPALAVLGREHWLLSRLNDSHRSRIEFILGQETVFTSAGNYSIGNHYAIQQSPYASRSLIETLALRPLDDGGAPSGSKLRMRLRDLRHRFLGEPEERSFQRRLVRNVGGFAAQCPVNWGWRPSGGVSTTGAALGLATLAGMLTRAKGWETGIMRRPLAASGLADLHDFRDSRRWLSEHLRDYTMDLLSSASLRNADLFDQPALRAVLDEHFNGRNDHYRTVVFALDTCLAHTHFCQTSVR